MSLNSVTPVAHSVATSGSASTGGTQATSTSASGAASAGQSSAIDTITLSNAWGNAGLSLEEQELRFKYLSLQTQVRAIVFQQMNNATEAAPINLASAVSYLLDASYDINKAIQQIAADTDENGELNAQQREAIGELRNLQDMVAGLMSAMVGFTVTGTELRSLTERDAMIMTNKNTNALKDPLVVMDEKSRYETMRGVGSKVGSAVRDLINQASELISSAQSDPLGQAFSLTRALRLLNQAEALLVLSSGGGDMTAVFAAFDGDGTPKAQIQALKNQAQSLLQRVGQTPGLTID